MVYCIGLTGNIASGKSTVAAIFSELGIDVINADKISRDLTAKNQAAYNFIIEHFGPEILLEDGELNRRHLRDIIFSNSDERRWLEELLHPMIRSGIEHELAKCTSPYCVIEIPLLFNTEHYPYVNRVLLVTASVDTQISRVMQRDQCSVIKAQAILSVQPDLEMRLKLADDVIHNNSSYDDLYQQSIALHKIYLQKAQDK